MLYLNQGIFFSYFARGRFDGRERMWQSASTDKSGQTKALRRMKICWIIHGQTMDTRTQTGADGGQRVFLYNLIGRPVGKDVRHVLTFDWQRDSQLDGHIHQHSHNRKNVMLIASNTIYMYLLEMEQKRSYSSSWSLSSSSSACDWLRTGARPSVLVL